jgi:hypothetical protein
MGREASRDPAAFCLGKPTIHTLVSLFGNRKARGRPLQAPTGRRRRSKQSTWNYAKKQKLQEGSLLRCRILLSSFWSNTARPSLRQVPGIAHLVFLQGRSLELLHRFASEQSYAAKSDKSASGIPVGCGVRGSSSSGHPAPFHVNLQASFQYCPVAALPRFPG